HKTRWPTVDASLLVALWAVIALAFSFAIPLGDDRYAMSVVVFAWPGLVAEVQRRGKAVIWLGLAVCCAVSLTRSSYYLRETIAMLTLQNENYRSMNAVLREA